MTSHSRGFKIVLLPALLLAALSMTGRYAAAQQRTAGQGGSAGPACGNHVVMIAASGVSPTDVRVCPGDSITWKHASANFDIHFDSPAMASQAPTASAPHPARASDFDSDTTTHEVTGYDASAAGPSNCGKGCYTYTVTVNGQEIDPHVIIVPPGS
jgi:plastocyanin